MGSLIICFIVLFLLSKIFEKALVLDIDLRENKDHETGNDIEEMLDTLIFFVQENNKMLELVARNMVYAETGDVTNIVKELADLIDEQQDKIARYLLHQKLEKNKVLTEKFMTMKGKFPSSRSKNTFKISLTAIEVLIHLIWLAG
ncbi:26200_t:CDS:2 [Dentiscutata erythropus]|uniref:26200_t:CDS:1 n=1 Tax=Dentiscutata erythropus TaxID=1348616 RepID=A0A9N9E121_9GLOM|nr:26200_t:CDS:2 [Dentiscutata erythropus]